MCGLLTNYQRFLILSWLSILIIGFSLTTEIMVNIPACPLCNTERILIGSAGALGLWSLWRHAKPSFFYTNLCGMLYLCAAATYFYHFGVQSSWWSPPSFCAGEINSSDLTAGQLLQSLRSVSIVSPCSQVSWSILGISATVYGLAYSLLGTVLSLFIAFKERGR